MTPQRFRILFDGNQISETPDGWQDIVSKITRNKDLNALFITTEADLTFRSDGYDYLIPLYEDSYCNEVKVDMQEWCGGHYTSFAKGIIFLSRATVDRKNCTIKVLVEDNSYYAKINNNKGIEVHPKGQVTKLGSDMDAAPITKMFFFDPNTGNYGTILVTPDHTCAGYKVYDLFAYMIEFMTDGELEFDSELFGSNGTYGGLFITCGAVIRQALGIVGTTEEEFINNFAKLSFQKLFSEVHKKVNIGMYVDFSGTKPKIRIEREADIRTEGTSFQAVNIDGLLEKVDSSRIFGTVRLGSSTTSDKAYDPPETGLLFPEEIDFRGFKDEQYYTVEVCNIDRELDLVSEFIISSNVIEDCYIHGESSYDDDTFMIMADIVSTTTVAATQDNIDLDGSGVPPQYYNMELTNQSSIDNFFGAVPASIASYLGNRDETIEAINTVIQNSTFGLTSDIVVDFSTEISDPLNLWNTNVYTVPAGGLYSFSVHFTVSGARPFDMVTYIERRDSTNTITLALVIIDQRTVYGVPSFAQIDASGSIPCDTGDLVRIYITGDHGSIQGGFQVDASSGNPPRIKCTSTETGGGIYKTFDPNDYPVRQHEWEFPLTLADFQSIERNQTDQIEFYRYHEKHYSGWIDLVQFKRFSDEKAKFITYRAKFVPRPTNEPIELRQVQISGQLADIPFTVNTPDYYGDPFGGVGAIVRTLFYGVNKSLTISIPSTHLGCDAGNASNQTICVTKIAPSGTTATCVFVPALSTSFVIEADTNYIVSFGYDLLGAGNTFPSVQPFTTSPATAGALGVANIILVNPSNPADYTFLWSNGATTQSINAVAGNYWCEVTYTPATFDTNVIRFNIQIPVSETGS